MSSDLPSLFDMLSAHSPDSVAFVSGDLQGKYSDLVEVVAGVRADYSERSEVIPDRVFLKAETSPGTIVALLTLVENGAVPCLFSDSLPKEIFREHRASVCPGGATIILSDFRKGLPPDPKSRPLAKVEAAEPPQKTLLAGDPDRWAAIVFTSGSSGPPKPAVLTYRNLVGNALISNENLPLGPGDRWLLSLPLYHVSGLGVLFRCLVAGATIAIPEENESLADAFDRYDITHVSLVATQLHRLLRDGVDLSGLKAILLGGGPAPERLVREAVERGLPLYTTYGLTETASQVTTTRPGDSLEKLLSSGKPLREGTITIAEDGEILVRGETRFAGYLRKGELGEPFTKDGWFATGDLGKFDADGYLHVVGRKDNMFISGGENIHPEEIEAEVCMIEGVESALVVPVDNEEFGQRPVAFVRTDSGEIDPTKILGVLEDRLPRFKVPDAIYAWPDDLANTGLKASRAELRMRAARRPRES